MLEPTDRVLAKTALRAWIDAEYINGTSATDFAFKFTKAIFPLLEKNLSLLAPMIEVFTEVVDEVLAEAKGKASPNADPYPLKVPQPWNEDAGGGC